MEECSMKEIPLTKGFVAVVDDEDYPELSKHKWHALVGRAGSVYAIRTIHGSSRKNHNVLMHRVILNVPPGVYVDHKNRIGIDNRKCNLRTCSISQNAHNRKSRSDSRTGVKGVSWNVRCKKYEARITHKGKRERIGMFLDIHDAAVAYNERAVELAGEFAALNVPPPISRD